MQLFRLGHPEFLYLFVSIPVLIVLFVVYARWRKQKLKLYAEKSLFMQMVPDFSPKKAGVKFTLFLVGYAFVIAALTDPQIGSKLEEVKREGVEIMLCIDLSNSMNAEDLTPSRIERAKRGISQLIDKIKSDRIGIIVFAGESFVQLPITTDYSAAKLFLNTINTDLISTQGTAIGSAISLAMESFDEKSPAAKSIIVITDGENHEDNAIEMAEEAHAKNITVHTIGMGTVKGAPIPLYRNGQLSGYRKDNQGNSVVTKLNEEMLQQIAEAGHGTYYRASNADSGLEYILNEISKMPKVEFGSKMFTDYESRYQYFIGFALLILLFDLFLLNRKNRVISGINLFKENAK